MIMNMIGGNLIYGNIIGASMIYGNLINGI